MNPLPLTLIVVLGVPELGDSVKVTTDTFVEARLVLGWAGHSAVTKYGPVEVPAGIVIACWKSPLDPLAATSTVPFADTSTTVFPAESVHWVKPLPLMVTCPPAWTICAEGVSAGLAATAGATARAGHAERTTATRAADRAASPLLSWLRDSIAITAGKGTILTRRTASAAQIHGTPGS
jgi:hypothetical protein